MIQALKIDDTLARLIVDVFQSEDEIAFYAIADYLNERNCVERDDEYHAKRFRCGNWGNNDYYLAIAHLFKDDFEKSIRFSSNETKYFQHLLEICLTKPILWKWMREFGILKEEATEVEEYDNRYGPARLAWFDEQFARNDDLAFRAEGRLAKRIIFDILPALERLGQWTMHRKWKRLLKKYRLDWWGANAPYRDKDGKIIS